MFRKDLIERFKEIFGVEKVTFDEPSDSYEQDCIFVEIIGDPGVRAMEGKITATVRGAIVIYSQRNKLPYGFFNKKIQQADKALTKPLFFFDIDVDAQNSPARLQNISERRASFVFLYSAQYDPNQGELTKVNFE